ncbi:hypothetical protein ACFWB2_14695 [Streptomyces virginiae]|uniref:hypothetical protein n=1 Tax=Streptomyces TaxID=1883 RepID=UPI00093CF9CA|nr:hypothetical protein [Streptomyces sp. MJM1172]OKI67568.1 hypothetical protein AMK15_06250 [Streptomyces sp. MJM1172]
MAKQTGLGDGLLVGGYDLSGDTGGLDSIAGGPAALEMTGIDKYGFERFGGVRDGRIEWSSWFNKAAGQQHAALKTLPRGDVVVTYLRGRGLGNQAASLVAKQVNYDGKRSDDAALVFSVESVANAYGLEWGQQLTPGIRTDTTATNGGSLDTTQALSFGGQAYLQVTTFTGTDVTVKIQDSADNSSWADVTGLGFTQVTAARTSQRLALANTATIRRYVRAVTTTSGGFSSASFVVMLNKNEIAGVSF